MGNKLSMKPCPICHTMMLVIGTDSKGKKITSCGHSFKFKRTRSQKEMDRKYVSTPDGGLELVKEDAD
jgi:hypothetical protein